MVAEELIIKQYEAAKQKFPQLSRPERVGDVWEIKGSIDVIDDEGSYWDTYEVKIIVPSKFPEGLFQLHEIGNKIKRDASWHNTVYCCLSTDAIMFYEMRNEITLLNWLLKFAHPFLANHVFRKKTDHYAGEEFDHGEKGIIQGYFKVFQTTDIATVIEKLKLLTGNKKIGRNSLCFCDSGKKYKRCYLLEADKHSSGIPISVLQKDLNQITNYICKTKNTYK